MDKKVTTLTTKELLLITAERLFSEHSIDSVSLRQIAVEAGQKNTSALNYHFGSKDDLITAIFSYRMPFINQQRLDYIAKLEKESRIHDLHALVEALVLPLANQLRPGGAQYYIGFQEDLIRTYSFTKKRQFYSEHDQSIIYVSKLIREVFPDMPQDLLNLRIGLTLENNVLYLNEWRRINKERGEEKAIHKLDCYLENMILMFSASLAAPIPSCLS